MPAPKPDKSLLTATEKERLADEKLDPIIRKRNDMIVRNKILLWLNNSNDVQFALEHLPIRKLKKELEDEYIYRLLEIVRELLDMKDFCKLYDIGKEVMAVKAIVEHHNPNFRSGSSDVHSATELDFDRVFKLENALEEIKSLIPDFETNRAYEKYKEEQIDKFANTLAAFKVNGKTPSEADFWHKKGRYILFGNPREPYPKSRLHIEKSIKYFNNALEIDPKHYDSWLDKAYALGELGAYKEALECIDKSLAIDSSDPEIWRLRAIYNQFNGNPEDSLKNLDKCLELDPSETPAIIMKIDILKGLGREIEAEDLISHHFSRDKRLRKLKGW